MWPGRLFFVSSAQAPLDEVVEIAEPFALLDSVFGLVVQLRQVLTPDWVEVVVKLDVLWPLDRVVFQVSVVLSTLVLVRIPVVQIPVEWCRLASILLPATLLVALIFGVRALVVAVATFVLLVGFSYLASETTDNHRAHIGFIGFPFCTPCSCSRRAFVDSNP